MQLAAGHLVMHLAMGSAFQSGANSDTSHSNFRTFAYFDRGGDAVNFLRWEEWITVILGAWLIVCPWILGISVSAARTNFVVVGLLVMALALYEFWEARSKSNK